MQGRNNSSPGQLVSKLNKKDLKRKSCLIRQAFPNSLLSVPFLGISILRHINLRILHQTHREHRARPIKEVPGLGVISIRRCPWLSRNS